MFAYNVISIKWKHLRTRLVLHSEHSVITTIIKITEDDDYARSAATVTEVVKLRERGKSNNLHFSSPFSQFVVIVLTKVVDMLIQSWAYRRHQSRSHGTKQPAADWCQLCKYRKRRKPEVSLGTAGELDDDIWGPKTSLPIIPTLRKIWLHVIVLHLTQKQNQNFLCSPRVDTTWLSILSIQSIPLPCA